MKRIWNFLNSPLIAVLIGQAVWLGAAFYILINLSYIEDDNRRADALSQMELLTMHVESDTSDKIMNRCVGTIRNNSQYIVSEIDVAICLYDSNNRLRDVVRQRIDVAGVLLPKQEIPFSVPVSRDYGDFMGSAGWKNDDGRLEIRFVDLHAAKRKE